MKQYKAIFLDWDDTIGDWTNAEYKALQDIYANYHLKHLYTSFEDYLAVYKPYNLELWGKYGQGKVTKEKLHFERFYRPLLKDTAYHQPTDEIRQMVHNMGDEFLQLTNKYFSLLPDASEVVHALAAKYSLSIVSNGFHEVQYYKVAHSGLQDCFAHLLVSDEIGINKPQPEIFHIALQLNNVKAEEVLMIGDSYSSDIAGAKAAGIDQLWIHSGKTEETATYIVPRLRDVLNILL